MCCSFEVNIDSNYFGLYINLKLSGAATISYFCWAIVNSYLRIFDLTDGEIFWEKILVRAYKPYGPKPFGVTFILGGLYDCAGSYVSGNIPAV